MLVGATERATVEDAVERQHGDHQEFIEIHNSKLLIAPQVPPDMPVKSCTQILDWYVCNKLFVTEGGQVRGIVSFSDILHFTTDRYSRRLGLQYPGADRGKGFKAEVQPSKFGLRKARK